MFLAALLLSLPSIAGAESYDADAQMFNSSLGIEQPRELLRILYVASSYGELHPCPT